MTEPLGGCHSSSASADPSESCDFTAHLCTGIIHECYKLLVYPLFKINEYSEESADVGSERRTYILDRGESLSGSLEAVISQRTYAQG